MLMMVPELFQTIETFVPPSVSFANVAEFGPKPGAAAEPMAVRAPDAMAALVSLFDRHEAGDFIRGQISAASKHLAFGIQCGCHFRHSPKL
jgi:hypothetical protein